MTPRKRLSKNTSLLVGEVAAERRVGVPSNDRYPPPASITRHLPHKGGGFLHQRRGWINQASISGLRRSVDALSTAAAQESVAPNPSFANAAAALETFINTEMTAEGSSWALRSRSSTAAESSGRRGSGSRIPRRRSKRRPRRAIRSVRCRSCRRRSSACNSRGKESSISTIR